MPNEKLHEIFNIEEPKEPVNLPVAVNSEQSEIEDDFQLARRTMRNLIEKGEKTLDEISELARNSEHPRTYEVAGQLMKTMAEISKDLVDLRKKNGAPAALPVTNQQNNVFVGSTSELLKMLKQDPPIDV